jgi:hypothetical protein
MFPKTAAGVFGYILLTLGQSLVQGKFVFADIPKNLPGIILISAATTATSQGITAMKGAKGAGDICPSVAHFVTTGGLVVAERFQFCFGRSSEFSLSYFWWYLATLRTLLTFQRFRTAFSL